MENTIPTIIAYSFLLSLPVLARLVSRAGRPYDALFALPRAKAMRWFYVSSIILQTVIAVVWLAAEPNLLGIPLIHWTMIVFLTYLWTRAIAIVRGTEAAM